MKKLILLFLTCMFLTGCVSYEQVLYESKIETFQYFYAEKTGKIYQVIILEDGTSIINEHFLPQSAIGKNITYQVSEPVEDCN